MEQLNREFNVRIGCLYASTESKPFNTSKALKRVIQPQISECLKRDVISCIYDKPYDTTNTFWNWKSVLNEMYEHWMNY